MNKCIFFTTLCRVILLSSREACCNASLLNEFNFLFLGERRVYDDAA